MSNRSHSEIYFHFVWSTKNRQDLISPLWEYKLFGYIIEKSRQRGYLPLSIGGVENHVHYLMRSLPEMAPCDIARTIKGASSRFVNRHDFLSEHFDWQEGYGVFSVSPRNVRDVIRYIKNQKEHHRNNTLIQELEEFEPNDDDLNALIEDGNTCL